MTLRTLEVRSSRGQELIDVTDAIADLVRESACSAVLVYVPHTTAGVLINEHADPDVARDILMALDHMVPSGTIYRHSEGNSSAHVKAAMIGTSQMVPVNGGRLALGTWQGIFFAEFDGPRTRRLHVRFLDVSVPDDVSSLR